MPRCVQAIAKANQLRELASEERIVEVGTLASLIARMHPVSSELRPRCVQMSEAFKHELPPWYWEFVCC